MGRKDVESTIGEGVTLPTLPSVSHHVESRLIRYALYVYAVLLLLFLWAPLAQIVFLSFADNARTVFPFQGFALEHYRATLADTGLLESVVRSAVVATVSSSLATVIGVLASLGIVRYEFPFKQTFRVAIILPLVVPGVILGLTLLVFFRSIVGIPTGFVTLVLTHSVYGLPFVVLPVTTRLYSFDESLRESARDLGADPVEAFVDVTLPLILPAVGAGFLFAWIRSFEDFIRAFFVRGTEQIMTTQMFALIRFGGAGVMNALSTLIIVAIAVALALAMNVGNVTEYVAD
jgi:ABC-type spermidine/putrescine transport system permease subunit II